MIRSIFYGKNGGRRVNLSRSEIIQALQEPEGVLWVSLEQPTIEEIQAILRDTFRFHPLAIEDTETRGYQLPKVDIFGDYLFIIAHAVGPHSLHRELETMELDFFLGRNYLVTSFHAPEMPPVEAVWRRLERDERLTDRGADFLCHAILDQMVDAYMPVIDAMDDEIDQIADEVMLRPEPVMLERILDLKHSTVNLRRIILPEREILNRLSRDDLPLIAANNRIYYRDIYDHLVRIHDLDESMRDIITSTLDIYLSATSNRLNAVMKTLTIVSTIFLPLAFMAGVYGMNFDYMPELHWRYGYLMAWLIFLGMTGVMLWFFKHKNWL